MPWSVCKKSTHWHVSVHQISQGVRWRHEMWSPSPKPNEQSQSQPILSPPTINSTQNNNELSKSPSSSSPSHVVDETSTLHTNRCIADRRTNDSLDYLCQNIYSSTHLSDWPKILWPKLPCALVFFYTTACRLSFMATTSMLIRRRGRRDMKALVMKVDELLSSMMSERASGRASGA